jgi:hypothetical protein
MQDLRSASIDRQKAWEQRISNKGKFLIDLRKIGERGVKELGQIKSTIQYVKQMRRVKTKKDELILTTNFNHEMPPLLLWN